MSEFLSPNKLHDNCPFPEEVIGRADPTDAHAGAIWACDCGNVWQFRRAGIGYSRTLIGVLQESWRARLIPNSGMMIPETVPGA